MRPSRSKGSTHARSMSSPVGVGPCHHGMLIAPIQPRREAPLFIRGADAGVKPKPYESVWRAPSLAEAYAHPSLTTGGFVGERRYSYFSRRARAAARPASKSTTAFGI